MKAKKIAALLVAAAMTITMIGCGNDANTTSTTEPAATETPADSGNTTATDVPEEVEGQGDLIPVDASLDFENGNDQIMGFVNKLIPGTNEGTYSIADFKGTKAVKMESNGNNPCVAFDLGAILGDKIADVASIDLFIGTETGSDFYAASGSLGVMAAGNSYNEKWSVYLDTVNPKIANYKIPDGVTLQAGDSFGVAITTDNCLDKTGVPTIVYIDNLAFRDASGKLIEADADAVFALGGVQGDDPNLTILSGVQDLGFSAKGDGWAQAGKAWADIADKIQPGCVFEIEYSCKDEAGKDSPVWFVYNGLVTPDTEWGWVRGVNEEDHLVPNAQYSTGKVQFCYDDLAAFWGEGFETAFADGAELQCEAQYAWEVYSIKVGMPTTLVALTNVQDLGFSAKGDAWSQAGKAWADIASKIYPGCVIDVEYSCVDESGNDSPIWFVYNGLVTPDTEWGWVRGVNEEDHLVPNAGMGNGRVQFHYEDLVAFWGEGFESAFAEGAELQGEAQYPWEIYSIKVGDVAPKNLANVVDLGFSAKGDGWSQAGKAWADIADKIYPGCVLDIEYNCVDESGNDSPIWFVYNGLVTPDTEWGWVRCAAEPEWTIEGATLSKGRMLVPYESLAAVWGDGFESAFADGAELQGEAQYAWEIYSIKVGTMN